LPHHLENQAGPPKREKRATTGSGRGGGVSRKKREKTGVARVEGPKAWSGKRAGAGRERGGTVAWETQLGLGGVQNECDTGDLGVGKGKKKPYKDEGGSLAGGEAGRFSTIARKEKWGWKRGGGEMKKGKKKKDRGDSAYRKGVRVEKKKQKKRKKTARNKSKTNVWGHREGKRVNPTVTRKGKKKNWDVVVVEV